ncbi:MAG: hypothetical protein DMF56_17245 [Acidobacteria bacterium]|nr:MAG: hypothetical protein DMF56_17245 [Acidobacteriota bacterium]
MRRLTFTVPFLLFAVSVAGQQPAKQPWEWTLDERLAVRLDPASIAKREQRQQGMRQQTAGEPLSKKERQSPQKHSIDGSENPELLLPHELFDGLITGFVPDDFRRRHQRENFRRGIIATGFEEEEFWSTLRSASATYIDNYAYPVPGTKPPPIPGVRWTMCREAFLALNRARQAFGKEKFDRFLYEFVAPTTQVGYGTNAADPAADLRFVEEGCN